MAGRYTHGHHESVLRSHRWRTADNSAAHLRPHLRPGLSLLDVGSGPGTITADLARIVAPGLVTALEATPEALDLTRGEINQQGLASVDFVVGDVHALPYDDESFDVVHTHQVLHHVADPVQALAEMRRVCRPVGLIAARETDYHGFAWWPLLPELDEWMALYQQIARANGGEPDAGRRLLSWAQGAGLTDITATSSTWCFATAEDRAWWGGSWAERIRHSAIADQALASGLATSDDLDRIARGWLRWAEAPDGWLSLLHAEIIARP